MLLTLRNFLGPLFLILICPPFVMLMWYTNAHLDGSLYTLYAQINQKGLFETVYQIWSPYWLGSTLAWKLLSAFICLQLILMRILPGKPFLGPLTPKGNTPSYKENGLLAFAITMASFSVASFGLHLFPASILYDNLGSLLGASNLFSLIFCGFLYFKGRYFPSSTDSGTTTNPLFDYYWGTELYPQMMGWNVKKFITCRFGMMSWGLLLLSYAAKQTELNGTLTNSMFVSVFLQFLYLTKFFMWEKGYLRSLDIMHDRAGFYICWGCLVWLPCIYTSPSMYLVLHPTQLSQELASCILIFGALSVGINYLADRQRLHIRSTHGQCKIWGKKPRLLTARYTTQEGDKKETLLLASGWWGIARHFHYVPEIAAAFFWSLPALFTHFSPYFYVCFLTILLLDRAFRDDNRCATKYNEDWRNYCNLVPYKIIPYVI